MVDTSHGQVRAVTHHDVSADDIDTVIRATREALAETAPRRRPRTDRPSRPPDPRRPSSPAGDVTTDHQERSLTDSTSRPTCRAPPTRPTADRATTRSTTSSRPASAGSSATTRSSAPSSGCTTTTTSSATAGARRSSPSWPPSGAHLTAGRGASTRPTCRRPPASSATSSCHNVRRDDLRHRRPAHLGAPLARPRHDRRRPVPAVRPRPRAARRAARGDHRPARGRPRASSRQARTRAAVPQVRLWQRIELETAAELPTFLDEIAAAADGRPRRAGAPPPRPGRSTRPRSPSSCTGPGSRGRSPDGTDDWPIGRERHDALVALRAFDGLDADDDPRARLAAAGRGEGGPDRPPPARSTRTPRRPRSSTASSPTTRPTSPAPSTPIATRCSGARQHLIDHDLVTIPADERIDVIETPEYLRNVHPVRGLLRAGDRSTATPRASTSSRRRSTATRTRCASTTSPRSATPASTRRIPATTCSSTSPGGIRR